MYIFERFEVDDVRIQSMLEVLDSLRRHEQEVYDDMRKSTPDKFSYTLSNLVYARIELYVTAHKEYIESLFMAEQTLNEWAIKRGYNYGVYIRENESGHHYLEK